MPHFGLMDADALGPVEAPLQRARLHIRGGRRRLDEGKISAGIVTLYDALEQGMEWYLAAGRERERLTCETCMKADSLSLYAAFVEAGIVDGAFDFGAFDSLVEEALEKDFPDHDYRGLLVGVERVMTQLGIMPFDEGALPPEDPSTF